MKKFGWIGLLLLSGCMVGPDYKAPQLDPPQTWETTTEEVSLEEPLAQWWETFKDPLLTRYIQLAKENNNDLRAAEENILQARGIKKIAASRLYPQLSAELNATRQRYSDNGPLASMGVIAVPKFQNLFNALFDATWEIDLFGKTRRLTQAAGAYIERQIEKKNDLLISLFAEVARNYIEERGNQKLRALIEEQISLQEKTVAIDERRFESGYISAFDLAQSQATLASARAALPPIQANIYAGIYALSVLTGNYPAHFVEEMKEVKALPQAPDIVAIGLQSDLLRRRPDVRQRERELAAATALVGYAVASFYPTISLTADGGFQAQKIRELFQGSSKMWSIGGDILMPLFKGGRLVGQLRSAEASMASAAYTYQQTILNALQDTETALTTYLHERTKTDYLDQNVTWNLEKTTITRHKFESGLVSLTTWLDLQRNLNATEQTLTQSKIATLTDLVALYKALGGGWD